MVKKIENQDYAKMLKRMVVSAGRRFADSDPDDLQFLMEVRDLLEEQIAATVHGLNASGYSLDQIAKPMGIARQNLHRKYFAKRKVA